MPTRRPASAATSNAPRRWRANITCRQAALANDMIWEHYHQDWSVDWEYNLHDKTNIYRPWGYQPGHHTEWAKLLLQLDAHLRADWHLPRAEALFKAGVTHAWDAEQWRPALRFRPRCQYLRRRQVSLGASRVLCRRRAARPAYREVGVLGLVCEKSGTTAGSISLITSRGPGFASSTARTSTTPVKRARVARSTTTISAPVFDVLRAMGQLPEGV